MVAPLLDRLTITGIDLSRLMLTATARRCRRGDAADLRDRHGIIAQLHTLGMTMVSVHPFPDAAGRHPRGVMHGRGGPWTLRRYCGRAASPVRTTMGA